MDEIKNRVASSALVSLDLEELVSIEGEIETIDIKEALFQGMVLKEADFREYIKNKDWSAYQGKNIGIHCSSDAIVPTWAFMLAALALAPYARRVEFTDRQGILEILFNEKLNQIDPEDYRDAKVVVKGCSSGEVPISAYVKLSVLLAPVVKSIMFGEPCSTVPLFKR